MSVLEPMKDLLEELNHVETPPVPKTTYELLMEKKYETLFTACMEAQMRLGLGQSERALQVLSQALTS